MPKEFIECRDFGRMVPTITDSKSGEVEMRELDRSAVKVGWNRERQVELAVVESVDGHYDEHGFDFDGEETGSPVPRYIELDRAGINRLIRTLRKARDAAYGADA